MAGFCRLCIDVFYIAALPDVSGENADPDGAMSGNARKMNNWGNNWGETLKRVMISLVNQVVL